MKGIGGTAYVALTMCYYSGIIRVGRIRYPHSRRLQIRYRSQRTSGIPACMPSLRL